MPKLWAYGHIDWKYIKSVHKKFGLKKIKTYPRLTLSKFIWFTLAKRVKLVSILNYIDYDREKAMQLLTDDLQWQYYGGKHYESIYTKFYQGVILPEKFNIDKRKLHLSALILAVGMTKLDALKELEEPIYPEGHRDSDTEYLVKKIGMSSTFFEGIMNEKPKTFMDYSTNYGLHGKLRNFLSTLRKKGLYHK
jgi:hypothetical protein